MNTTNSCNIVKDVINMIENDASHVVLWEQRSRYGNIKEWVHQI